jgi:hypothetical protein
MHTKIMMRDLNPWRPGFAWWPIRIDGRWRWLYQVEWRFDLIGPINDRRDVIVYRLPEARSVLA